MKKLFSLVVLLTLSACTSLSDLRKPEKEQYFVLTQDHVRTEVRGLAGNRWTEGLKAGKYVAVAEDDDGIYFKGEGASVMLLVNEEGDAYLKSGKVPEAAEKANRFPRAVNVGGLWIPRKASGKEPKLFYEIRNTTDGSTLGLTGVAIVSATEGALNFAPFGSEKEFVNSLKIMSK